jgi:uncharacterized protein (DUF433 family)
VKSLRWLVMGLAVRVVGTGLIRLSWWADQASERLMAWASGHVTRELEQKWIDADPWDTGCRDDARLRESGIPVWSVVSYYQGPAERDVGRVARDYYVSTDAVRAALAYYHVHRRVIDARLLLMRQGEEATP